ncbi:MAG TPA: amidohydrolase family protein [Alphaproteobacteria bacterium]|nr:amidohydrolase family protein [Alphaproteobacteria bacterium]
MAVAAKEKAKTTKRAWLGGLTVVDGDGHVGSTPETWERYMDEPYRSHGPRIVKDNRGSERWMVEGILYPKPEGTASGQPEGIRGSMLHPGVSDPLARLKDMDSEGIDIAVCFGNLPELTLAAVMDPGLAVAMARAYNNWVADYCSVDPRRLKAVAVLPMQDVAASVAELRRATKELGLIAAMLPTNVRGKNLDHPDYLPVFAEAARLGVPLTVHGAPSTGSFAGSDRFENYFFTHAVAHPFEQMISLMCIVCGGILERFPDLRVAFLESGIGWVPYWVERLDEHFEHRAKLVPNIKRKPSDYVDSGRVFFFCEPEEKMLPYVAGMWEDSIVFTSDYPHWDAKFPGAVAAVAERKDLTERQKRKILSENAARFYGLSL